MKKKHKSSRRLILYGLMIVVATATTASLLLVSARYSIRAFPSSSSRMFLTATTTTTAVATTTTQEDDLVQETSRTTMQLVSSSSSSSSSSSPQSGQQGGACHDKERLLQIVRSATETTTAQPKKKERRRMRRRRKVVDDSNDSKHAADHDSIICRDLPTWKQITDRYGDGPVVIGLDTCAQYRRQLADHDHANKNATNATTTISATTMIRRPKIRVAGLWNTGTNAYAETLALNIIEEESSSSPSLDDAGGGDNDDDANKKKEKKLLLEEDKVQPVADIAAVASANNANNNQTTTTTRKEEGRRNRRRRKKNVSHPYNVPWGKHVPASDRGVNVHPVGNPEAADIDIILPVVLVRDPYTWMKSMCKHPYDVEWQRIPGRCPNLVGDYYGDNTTGSPERTRQDDDSPNSTKNKNKRLRQRLRTKRTNSRTWSKGININNQTVMPFTVRVAAQQKHHHRHYAEKQEQQSVVDWYESLAHLWTEWNTGYVDASFPRLLIRYEDTLFHAEAVMKSIRDCAGLSTGSSVFRYKLGQSKRHGNSTRGFVEVLQKYGAALDHKQQSRGAQYDGLSTAADLEYARKAFDPKLMQLFRYQHPPLKAGVVPTNATDNHHQYDTTT